jgi:predicted metal-dependent phosphoesterase TrpH
MRADLHVHSTASDGSLTPAELVRLALARGLDVLAISDHDSVEGIASALEAAAGTGLVLIPAVELSAVHGGRDIHLLAYFVDHTSEKLLAHLSDLRQARLHRAETMVAALNAAGLAVDIDQVLALSGGGAVGRSHIARALVDAGHAETVSDAFTRLIGRGKPYYVAKDARSPREVLATVVASGAVPVLAHPGVSGATDLVPQLVAVGLRGLEAYHADHTPAQRDSLLALAARFGLLVTGGTDFHGPGTPNPDLGAADVPEACVRALLAAGGPAWAARA